MTNQKNFRNKELIIEGIKNFLNLAETHNFKIEEQDLNIDYTNPITLLRK